MGGVVKKKTHPTIGGAPTDLKILKKSRRDGNPYQKNQQSRHSGKDRGEMGTRIGKTPGPQPWRGGFDEDWWDPQKRKGIHGKKKKLKPPGLQKRKGAKGWYTSP